MQAEEVHAEELFHEGQQLRIPIWQRHYSWDSADWRELWRDLLRLKGNEARSHFMGSVVVHEIGEAPRRSESRRLLVVDGQQRITTLTIIICALRDQIARLRPDTESAREAKEEITDQLLVSRKKVEDHQERLVLQATDHEILRAVIQGNPNDFSNSSISKAYAFFAEAVAGWSADDAETLIDIVRNRLDVVWVTLNDQDNAHRVFQTLNAGGKPLRQADLVRNYFFLLLGDQGEQFFHSTWSVLERDLGTKLLEDYFVAWSITKGHTGGKGSLFKYFQADLRDVEENRSAVQAYGVELVECSRLYGWIKDPRSMPQSRAREVLLDLHAWGTTPVEGILLYLLQLERAASISTEDLADGLEMVLSFLARRMLAGFEPNLHKSIAVQVLLKLRRRELRGSALIDYLHALLSVGGDVKTWPSDELVVERIQSTSIYTKARRHWVFSILERVNRYLHDNIKHAPDRLDRGKYQVEHVLPQTLTSRWEDDLRDWGVESPAALHAAKLHVLGNLTLTPINPELSNRPFEEKRKMLGDDFLRLNAQVADAQAWTQSKIEERGRALAQTVVNAFVAPMTPEQIRRTGLVDDAQVPPVLDDEELVEDELV